MTRFLGWVLRASDGHAHILAISDDGIVLMRDWMNNEWRAWGHKTFNEGSLQIQQAIKSWEDLGYERGDPLTIEVLGLVDLTDGYQRPDREQMDRVFKPFLDMAGIIPPEPAVPTTITSARLAGISFTAGPPPDAAVGDMWFDTSANSTYVFDGGSWDTMKGIA